MKERIYSLERELKRVENRLGKVTLKLEKHSEVLKDLSREMKSRQRREDVLMAALGLNSRSKVGDRGFLEDLDDSILRLEDYLLAMGDRVQRILSMLQSHRDFLDRVNESVLRMGQRERMRLELDIMMNSISILAIAGVEIDPSIASEIEKLRRDVAEGTQDLEELRRRKEELNRRLEAEIKRYDLSQLFSGKSNIPGYG
jgi:chromosome segregation ATPase